MKENSQGTFEEYINKVFDNYKGKLELITPQIMSLKKVDDWINKGKNDKTRSS